MDILDDKVRHEQEMRIMKEERYIAHVLRDQEMRIMKEERDIDRHKIANLEQRMTKLVEQNALIIKQNAQQLNK
jgi:hypothetical protein